MCSPSHNASHSDSHPILVNRSFRARNATTTEDYEESEFGTEDGEDGILIPTSAQARASGLDDLPPTYEEVQAQLSRGGTGSARGQGTVANPLQQTRTGPTGPASVPVNHERVLTRLQQNSSPHLAQHTPVFTQQTEPIRGPGLRLPVIIPTMISANRPAIPQFASPYSWKLSNVGIASSTFLSFVEGLNQLLVNVDAMMARRDLLSIADSVGEKQSVAADRIVEYLQQSNQQIFNPKGLEVRLETVIDLINRLDIDTKMRRTEVDRMRRAIWDAKTEKEAVAPLQQHIEPLTWSVPLQVHEAPAAGPSHRPSPHDRQGSASSLRALQCPWEFEKPSEMQQDWQSMLPSKDYSTSDRFETSSQASILTPATTHRSQDDPRTSQAGAALSAILNDSDTDSDASTDSNTESRIHSHNRLAEAHRHYGSVVKSIERTAREKIFDLGDNPPPTALNKYEGKRSAKLNHAAAVKHAAEVEYSVKTLQRRHRRANKWRDRELKKDGVKIIKHQASAVRQEHSRRVEREAVRHGERVRRAGEELAHGQQNRALDQHESVTGCAKGRRKLAWEVWLVVRNMQG